MVFQEQTSGAEHLQAVNYITIEAVGLSLSAKDQYLTYSVFCSRIDFLGGCRPFHAELTVAIVSGTRLISAPKARASSSLMEAWGLGNHRLSSANSTCATRMAVVSHHRCLSAARNVTLSRPNEDR